MSINIKTNLPALITERYLNMTTNSLGKSFERLSSGLRITNGSDDAAGLAVADQLLAQSRVASVAIRNANDGISVINIINCAVDEMSNILTRLSELAEQSANGIYGPEQRGNMQSEYMSLAAELQRIAMTTQFNDKLLLADGVPLMLQVGYDGGQHSQIIIPGMNVTLFSLGLSTDLAGTDLIYNLVDTVNVPPQDDVAQANSRVALDAFRQSLSMLNDLRGVIGSTNNRLNMTVSNLGVSRENYKTAESQIRDVDIASESAEMVRLTIAQQAASAILAQANQQPAMALTLLKP